RNRIGAIVEDSSPDSRASRAVSENVPGESHPWPEVCPVPVEPTGWYAAVACKHEVHRSIDEPSRLLAGVPCHYFPVHVRIGEERLPPQTDIQSQTLAHAVGIHDKKIYHVKPCVPILPRALEQVGELAHNKVR